MRAKGFTLIEMLVAITLVALMGVVCWRGLSFVANQRAFVAQETTELSLLVRAFAQMQTDVDQRLPDIALPARATTPELPLAVSIGADKGGSATLEILRTVATDATQSRLSRILYRIDERGLVRNADTGEVVVLPGAIRLRLRVEAGASSATPPITRAGAIEVVVDDGEGSRYVKVIAL